MAENLIAEIRQLLEEIVVPELKAARLQLDGIQRQLELSEQSFTAQLDALRAELETARGEMVAMRRELDAQRNEPEDAARGARKRYLM